MKLKSDHVKYLEALRPTHWEQLLDAVHTMQFSGCYYGNRQQYEARTTTLEGVISCIATDQRKRAK